MQLFIFLALFMVPLAGALLYPVDSYAQTDEFEQNDLFFARSSGIKNQQVSLVSRHNFSPDEKAIAQQRAVVTQIQDLRSKKVIRADYRAKKIQLIRNRKSAKCMSFLSFLALLKGRQQ